ncbi:MAG: histone deacetylase [Aureliella sp.]
MHVFYCDHFELPLPEGHRFPIEKYERSRLRVRDELGEAVQFSVAPAATARELLAVHEPSYVDRAFNGTLSPLEQKRIGFPWSPKMLERSRRSTGATIATAQMALHEQVSVHLSGGTHHAFRDEGQGFCVFNDVAVAAMSLFISGSSQNIRRALVIDLDVHQGNGTASIFQNDERVFTFSIHGDRNYPFRKTQSDLDIGLADGTKDDDYLAVLNETLENRIPDQFDFVFYIAGADPHRDDRMGRMHLTTGGLMERDRVVFEYCRSRRLPIAVVMGGGYGPIETVAQIHANTATCAFRFWKLAQQDLLG